jgi:hypothetical protein
VVLSADAHRRVVAGIATFAVLVLAAALARALPSLLPWALVALGAAYAVSAGGGAVDQWAPVYGGALLAIAELGYWSLELRGRTEDAERLTERRAALIGVLALGSVFAGGVVLAATSVPIGTGVLTDLAGVVGAIAALAVVASFARSK